jgi:16S rRNA processing protein RimM
VKDRDDAAGTAPEPRVVLAAIAGAHGINGEVRLKLFAEGIDSLRAHARRDVGGRSLTLVSARAGKMPVARFAEITDRNAAEALRGAEISVPRSALPPLGEGEYYHADLIGLACVDRSGTDLGRVVAVENFGAGDLLEVERPGGRRALIPFREGIADWDAGAARIVLDPEFLAG